VRRNQYWAEAKINGDNSGAGKRPVKFEFIQLENHHGDDQQTQAVRAGNLIHVGGQMSLDAQGYVIGKDIATQTKIAFDSLKRVL
jgi:enamine deaminase RidA (YjgF/YER057c/UK114 family)